MATDVISYVAPSGTEVLNLDSDGDLTVTGQVVGATGDTVAAANVSIADAAASLVAATVEAALAELATPLTLAVGAEAANVIAVTVTGPAAASQYWAILRDANGVESVVGAFTMAETGGGAEVSTTAKPQLLFTTSASGAAILSITDVVGASGSTIYLTVSRASASAGSAGGHPATVAVTFD